MTTNGFREVTLPRRHAAVGMATVALEDAPSTTSVAQVVAEAEPTVSASAPAAGSLAPGAAASVASPATPAASPATPASPTAPRATSGGPERDRYIDVLRVLALGRVVLYHLVGWAWLTVLFPSMGVMFALAGSLTAASLDREKRHYGFVLRRRLRRLLPPFWAFGAVLIALMFYLGWKPDAAGNGGPDWGAMAYWILPIAQPAGSTAAASWTVPLWYITTYLWLVLLSPALLWSFRRWPLKTLATPLLVMACVVSSVLVFTDRFGDVALNVATYAGCWLLGFAHHDKKIRALPLWLVLVVGGLLASAGLGWAVAYPNPETGMNVTDIPMASTLYSLGVVLILLRLYVTLSWLAKIRWLDGLVRAVNRRAMTIYLWGNLGIDVGVWILHQRLAVNLPEGGVLAVLLDLTATWVVIWVFVFAFGWVEDFAARRPLQIIPRSIARHRRPRPLRRWAAQRLRTSAQPRLGRRTIVDSGAAS